MRKKIRTIVIVMVCLVVFFEVLPILNRENLKESDVKVYPLYEGRLDEPITDTNHIALFGKTMAFPLKMSEMPSAFHIDSIYYDEMTDGIQKGDCFHCSLLNKKEQEIAYLRISNLKQNTAKSPDEMTVTYIEAASFSEDGHTYGVPFEIKGGIGIGSTYDEVKKVFPEALIDETEEYSILSLKEGILSITLEFSKQTVYKMAVEVY